jgi:hypothetical protein
LRHACEVCPARPRAEGWDVAAQAAIGPEHPAPTGSVAIAQPGQGDWGGPDRRGQVHRRDAADPIRGHFAGPEVDHPPVGSDLDWSSTYLPPIRAAYAIVSDSHELVRITADPELRAATLTRLVECAGELSRLKQMVQEAVRRLVAPSP